MRNAQLFITCLGDQFYAGTLQNMVRILEKLGVKLSFPVGQTCCGQPLFNNGFVAKTQAAARAMIQAFGESDAPVVGPSGSCVSMIRHHYPGLFPAGTPEHRQACELAGRIYEFTEYLVHVLKVTDLGAVFPHKVTYHASCHYVRDLGLRVEAKQLLSRVRDLELLPLQDEDLCCGFGGAFSVTFPEVSRAMMENKVRNIMASGADTVTMCDPGCLMNITGGLQRAGSDIRAMHLIDILASGGAVA